MKGYNISHFHSYILPIICKCLYIEANTDDYFVIGYYYRIFGMCLYSLDLVKKKNSFIKDN